MSYASAAAYAAAFVLAFGTPASAALPSPVASQSSAATRDIAAFASAWDGVTGYTTTVAIFDQKGTQTQNLLFNYTFRKPANVTVYVVAGPNAGVTMTWDGGPSVVAHHGSGFAAMFKRTIPLHDPLVTTLAGWSIDQLSFGAILAHGEQSAGSLSEGPAETIDGVSAHAVTLTPASAAGDDGLTREVVELSTVTHLPIRVFGYEGSASCVRSNSRISRYNQRACNQPRRLNLDSSV
jgi:predicted extracellular nuclease